MACDGASGSLGDRLPGLLSDLQPPRGHLTGPGGLEPRPAGTEGPAALLHPSLSHCWNLAVSDGACRAQPSGEEHVSLAWGGSVSWESVCSILKAKQQLSWQRGQCAQKPGTGWVPGELRAAVCGPCQWEKWADQALVLGAALGSPSSTWEGDSGCLREGRRGRGGRCEPQQDVGEKMSTRRRERGAPSRHLPPRPVGSPAGAGHTWGQAPQDPGLCSEGGGWAHCSSPPVSVSGLQIQKSG